eukprot:PhM_4_TR7189/c0_g1_i1/m.29960
MLPIAGPQVKVHSKDLFRELLQAEEVDDPHSHVREKKKTLSPLEARQTKARELQMQKKAAREADFQMQLEVAKKDADRRLRERARAQNVAFEKRFEALVDESMNFVRSVGEVVEEYETRMQRRKERLYDEWCQNVFDPIQLNVDTNVNSMSRKELNRRRCEAFEAYLSEFNKKSAGLFRDIIIEADYDPLAHQKSGTVKYKRPQLKDDPTKNRETREANRIAPPLQQQRRGGPTGARVDVTAWATIESTPYGWHANEPPEKTAAISAAKQAKVQKSTLVMDHYQVPTGDDGLKLMRKENNVRGKRFPQKVDVMATATTNNDNKPLSAPAAAPKVGVATM